MPGAAGAGRVATKAAGWRVRALSGRAGAAGCRVGRGSDCTSTKVDARGAGSGAGPRAALSQASTSSRCRPRASASGVHERDAAQDGSLRVKAYFGAVMAALIVTQRWSSCWASSRERRVPADRSFICAAAWVRRLTLAGVQPAGISELA